MTDQNDQTGQPQPLLSQTELADIIRQTQAARLYDRFGRPMLIGSDIELHGELPPVYTIIAAKPDLRHGIPPGMWILTLAGEMSVICQQGQRHQKMTIVGMTAEAVAAMQQEAGKAAGTAAASDATSAGGGSSIVLTDMDKTARATLAETKTGPVLVPAIDHGGEF